MEVYNGTNGPWYAVNAGPHWNNQSIINWQIQYGEDGECVSDHVYGESNAHLIAAAPDLLEALHELVRINTRSVPDKGISFDYVNESEQAITKAKAAINKALNIK